MKEKEERSEQYHLDPTSPELADEIIARERTDYVKLRPVALILILPLLALILFQSPAKAGGPKCDRSDKEKCNMANCSGMKDGKKSGNNCKSYCHVGCCSCPDGSDPLEGEACPRDHNQAPVDPEQGEPQR